jgi:hypothetical protein
MQPIQARKCLAYGYYFALDLGHRLTDRKFKCPKLWRCANPLVIITKNCWGYKLLGGNTYIVSGKRTSVKMTLVKTH